MPQTPQRGDIVLERLTGKRVIVIKVAGDEIMCRFDDGRKEERFAFELESPVSVLSTFLELLDAYSEAVIGVVERVGPAVASVSVAARREGGPGAGSGSGVLFTPDGYLLTNAHVVRGAKRVGVSLTDGSTLEASVVGADEPTDLAVLAVDGSRLPYAELVSPGALRVRLLVVAIANALVLIWTVLARVLSPLGRPLAAPSGGVVG